MSNVNVLVSVLNWNNAEATIRCLDSLALCGYLDDRSVNVLVLDNASEPADFERLSVYASGRAFTLSRNAVNSGFAGGQNQALRIAVKTQAKYVWLLNNDAIVPPGTLEKLVRLMEDDPSCGACSPVLAYEDTRNIYFTAAIHDWRNSTEKWCAPTDELIFREHNDALWLFGTALLLRTKAIEEVGDLREDYFAYCEDDELGERLRLAGWTSKPCKDAVVWHGPEPKPGSRRPGYFYFLTARNHTHFYLAYTPKEYRRFIRTRIAARQVHRADLLKKAGRCDLADALLLGLEDGFRGRLGAPRLARRNSWSFRAYVSLLRAANALHGVLRKATHRG